MLLVMLDLIAGHLRVTIISEPPLLGGLGEYHHAARVVRVRPGLSGPLLHEVVAHELGHAAYEHTTSTAVTEREADYFAHWVLIPFCKYLAATRMHHTAQGVAHELGVLPAMVEAYAGRVHDDLGP